MKKYIFILIYLGVVFSCFGQLSLSRSGAAHLRAAEVLAATATTTEDRLQVAEEYEKVIQSDPHYANAYLEAARVHTILTSELGESSYNKARTLLRKYSELMPSQSDIVDAEFVVLDAMLRKFRNKPEKIDGIWAEWSSYTRRYYDWLEVKNTGYGYTVKLVDLTAIFTNDIIHDVDVNVVGNICKIVFKVYSDKRSQLREKGWQYYVDDRDSNADPGFTRSGEYRYNEVLTTWYYTVDLSKSPLVMNCEKIHTDYFLNGSNTYSDTDRDRMYLYEKKLNKRK